MLVFVGLGNIGDDYAYTPHNAGFLWLKKLRAFLLKHNIEVTDFKYERKFLANIAYAYNVKIDTKILPNQLRGIPSNVDKILLVQPTTFMNLSGQSARAIVDFYKLNISYSFILIHDDLDIKLGEYKIQYAKYPKTHNGVTSVHRYLKTTDFMRIRLGVQPAKRFNILPSQNYLLKKMDKESLELLYTAIIDSINKLIKIKG